MVCDIIVLLLLFFTASASCRFISEHDTFSDLMNECSNEGEKVEVDLVKQNPCFHCLCLNGHVKCDYVPCPSLKGCHAILFMRTPGACCDQCKGCSVNGTDVAHGKVWTDSKDPCQVRMCRAGVLTKSRDICRPPCSNPVHVPGQCCPSCKGCHFEGKKYKIGQRFTSEHNPDLECSCTGGNITCVKRVCPVLNCPEEYLYRVPGQKCPQCKGQRRVYTLRESCYFAREVYDHGDVIVMDSCTSCVCQQGTMSCERQQCPDLKCPPSDRIFKQGECCPRCKQRPSCTVGEKAYQHGMRWKEHHCKECMCDNGKKWCYARTCPKIKSCPLGHMLAKPRGECCEKCIRDEKTCSVMGPRFDSFKTFDGFHYNMKGTCKYTLLRDCYQGEISVKIRYKKNQKRLHTSISHVSIRISNNRVKLCKNFKVRVNRTKLTSRRFSKSGTLYVRVNFPRVIIEDKKLGVRVIWNMNSNLKIKVDRRYRKSGRLCGLCGNFNGHKGDDFINEKGKLLSNSRQMSKAWSARKTCFVNDDNTPDRVSKKAPLPTPSEDDLFDHSDDVDSEIKSGFHKESDVDSNRSKISNSISHRSSKEEATVDDLKHIELNAYRDNEPT